MIPMNKIPRVFRNILACALIAAVAISGAVILKGQMVVVQAEPFTEAANSPGAMSPEEGGSQLSGQLVTNVAERPDITSVDEDSAQSDSGEEISKAGESAQGKDAQEKNGASGGSGAGGEGAGGNGGAINNAAPGVIPAPSGERAKGEFFITSIKDGDTVREREYSFTITHKRPDLKVKAITVSVGSNIIPQWNGRIELDEGANRIRVMVDYTDKNGKLISVYKDYTVNAILGDILITTSLAEQSGKTVYSPKLSFSAKASYGGQDIALSVKLGAEPVSGSGGNYSLTLKKGKNTVSLSAAAGGKTGNVSYNITYVKPEALKIETNLTGLSQSDPQILSDPNLSFNASAGGGAGGAKLTVVCDGVTLKGSKGKYEAIIKKLNKPVTVRIKASETVEGKESELEEKYYVKYVPVADEKTAPYLEHINVTDGMNVTGEKFTLEIAPVNYEKKKLGYNNVVVKLNGKTVGMQWSGEFIGYSLKFEGGANAIDIRVTDGDGRYSDFSYTVNCKKLDEGDSLGTITMSVDAKVLGLGYLIEPTEMEIFEGETGAEIVDRLLKDKGFTYKHTGSFTSSFYLARINKSGIGKGVEIPEDLVRALEDDGYEPNGKKNDDSIGEFDYYKGSGWMYSKNGSFPSYGFTDSVLKDGDEVKIRFTLAYGKDIGGNKSTGGDSGNYDKEW